MKNDQETNTFFNITLTETPKQASYSKQIYYLGILMIILAVGRIVTLDFFGILGDGLGVLMVYFFFIQRSKCMAIFLMINGALGLIMGVSRAIQSYQLAKLQWFSVYMTLVFTIYSFALLVYTFECYISFVGIKNYDWNMPGMPSSNSSNSNNNQGTYGSIPNNDVENNNNNNFKAFSGKGTTIG